MRKLKENTDDLLLHVLDNMSDSVILTDDNFRVTFLNNTSLNLICAITNSNLIGKHIAQLLDIINDSNQSLLEQYQLQLEAGKTVNNQIVKLRNTNGQHFRIELNIDVLPNILESNHHFKFVFKNSSSEETKPNLALLSQQIDTLPNSSFSQPFYSLAEKSPDIIYIIDIQKRLVVYFNRNELFGYDSKQLETSEGWIEIIHPHDIQKVQAHWHKFINTGLNHEEIEYRIKKKNETYEWVLNRHSVLERTSDSNLPKYVLLNITIITDRKYQEQQLIQEQNRLNSLIEQAQDMIWSVDTNFTFSTLNNATKNLFKNQYNIVISQGDHLLDVLPDSIKIEWMQWHRKAMQGQKFVMETQLFSSQKITPIELEFTPIYHEHGHIFGTCVFARNIESRKRNENDIIKANFELDSFVHRASHDLRAPLRSVLGLLQVVKNEENHEQRNHYLNLINKSINKLDAFISDLTNFSRNSRLELKKQAIDFQEIIVECMENLNYMEYASHIQLKTSITLTEICYSDNIRLAIVFQNLLSNAIKYSNPRQSPPWIKIDIANNDTHCLISIQDNGIGIKEQYMNQIFNMFFRATNDSFGSGLGLYITKQVVEKLGGEISLSSSYGQGTLFNIKIPMNSTESSS